MPRIPTRSTPRSRNCGRPRGRQTCSSIMLDDVGFGASSAFGGPCDDAELREARRQRPAVQSVPHDCAVLADPSGAPDGPQPSLGGHGRHHRDSDLGARDTTRFCRTPAAPLARTLKLNGYSTAQFGKCHEVPVWQTSPMGPFDAWPTGGGGFEYFYGFIGGETNQWYPALYEGTTPIEAREDPGAGLSPDRRPDRPRRSTGSASKRRSCRTSRSSPTSRRARRTRPHHVPKEWADKYKGKFDQGWDKLREETFARQKTLGVIPQDCRTHAASSPRSRPGTTISAEMKPVLARQMEVYAGFLEHTDHHVGRLIDALEDLGVLEDTLIYLIIGDNGASAEGSLQGCFNEMAPLNGFPQLETPEFLTRAAGQVRRRRSLQPLRGGLGARDVHALPVDQAGRLALGRHPQRHDRALAEGDHGQGRGPQPVSPRHRRRADHSGSGRPARADLRQRGAAASDRRRQHGCTRSTTPRRPSGTRRSISRWRATAASTTRAGRR